MDPNPHCTESELDGIDLDVNSSTMYPEMIRVLRGIVEGGMVAESEFPGLKPDNPIHSMYLHQARQLPANAWDMALAPMTDDEGNMVLSAENRQHRATALECARLVFTECLQQSRGGGPLSIRLTRDDCYRIRE